MGKQFIADVAQWVRAGSAPAITAEDGLRALQVVEAVYHSAETGRAVRLP